MKIQSFIERTPEDLAKMPKEKKDYIRSVVFKTQQSFFSEKELAYLKKAGFKQTEGKYNGMFYRPAKTNTNHKKGDILVNCNYDWVLQTNEKADISLRIIVIMKYPVCDWNNIAWTRKDKPYDTWGCGPNKSVEYLIESFNEECW